jgi:hypothetical protein
MSGAQGDDDGEDIAFDPIKGKWVAVSSAFPPIPTDKLRGSGIHKTIMSAAMTATSVGISSAQFATGAGTLAVIAGTATAATPVGLAIAAIGLTVATSVTNAGSAISSSDKAHALKIILMKHKALDKPPCKCANSHGGVHPEMTKDHALIVEKVLPYIIRQKNEKTVRKGIGAVPGLGLLTTAYRAGRAAFKSNRGAARGFYANVLARHLVTHDCNLTGAIVSILYSEKEMLVLRTLDSEKAGDIIKTKMKSI